MAISQEDWNYMRKVADYFQETISESQPEGSIRETAQKFQITRTKARKILVTCGSLNTPLVQRISSLRSQGLSIDEIAAEMSMSPSTVSTYLPYENKIDGSLAPSAHAAKVRQYRSYEKQQKQRFRDLKESTKKEDEDTPFRFEWASEASMSYQETFHRPYRETWEDAKDISKQMEAQFSSKDQELFSELNAALEQQQKQDAEEIALLDTLPVDSPRAKELRQKHGLYPGALNSRNRDALEKLYGSKLPFSACGSTPSPSGIVSSCCAIFRPTADRRDDRHIAAIWGSASWWHYFAGHCNSFRPATVRSPLCAPEGVWLEKREAASLLHPDGTRQNALP